MTHIKLDRLKWIIVPIKVCITDVHYISEMLLSRPTIFGRSCITPIKIGKFVTFLMYSLIKPRKIHPWIRQLRTSVSFYFKNEVKNVLIETIPVSSTTFINVLFNPLRTKCSLFYLNTQFAPRGKRFPSRLYNQSVKVVEGNKTGNVRMSHWGAFTQALLQRKSNEYHKTWVCVFVALGIQ